MKNYFLAALIIVSVVSASGQVTDTSPIVLHPKPGNYYIDSARPSSHIQSAFPYDISLRNAAGDTLNSASVFEKNGKPTVLMFWMTTCGPCRMELNAISEKFESWKQQANFNFYAVNTDFPKNFPQFINRVDESNWPFAAYHDLNREFCLVMPGELNGLPGYPFAVIGHPVANDDDAVLRTKAQEAVKQIVPMLLERKG